MYVPAVNLSSGPALLLTNKKTCAALGALF